jgi:hypothetical protein
MKHDADEWMAKAAIAELIRRWAFSRDNGRWIELSLTFAADGHIAVTWFNGSHADFVEASRKRHGSSFNRHVMLGSLTHVRGNRAWSESQVMMVGHGRMDGTPVRWNSHFRFIDLLGHDGRSWAIHRRTAVYDTDTMDVDEPGYHLDYDAAQLARFPRAYRHLGYRLSRGGLTVPLDLPTGGSAIEERLRSDALDWIA